MGNIQSMLSRSLSKISASVSKTSLKTPKASTSDSNGSLHDDTDNEQNLEYLPNDFCRVIEELHPSSKDTTRKEKTIRFQSFKSCIEYSYDNDKQERVHVYRRALSEVAVNCFAEINPGSFFDGESKITGENDLPKEKEQDIATQFTFACYEEISIENEVKQSTFSRTISHVEDSQNNLNAFTSQLLNVINNEIISNSEQDEEDEEEHQLAKVQKQRKMTFVATTDGTIQVNRCAKDIANYCMHLLTAQFAGQTTWSIKTDCSNKRHRGPHLGNYIRLMDSYLRHFDQAENFTGEEEYYLKLLWYIATKRHFPKETIEECFERLKADSKRFVKIYLERGGYSQPITTHNDFWGSRQQLLSGKVIADWVDPANGPLDPVFGVLLQPTAGRAGPGDAGWFHQVMFDGNGPCAYHSAVHDAFGYLKTDHGVGPGYDYMQNSRFQNSRPFSGQIGGLRFWKKVLQTEQMKPNVMDLMTQTLGLLPILSYDQVEGQPPYL